MKVKKLLEEYSVSGLDEKDIDAISRMIEQNFHEKKVALDLYNALNELVLELEGCGDRLREALQLIRRRNSPNSPR